jgi:hypothetical protein
VEVDEVQNQRGSKLRTSYLGKSGPQLARAACAKGGTMNMQHKHHNHFIRLRMAQCGVTWNFHLYATGDTWNFSRTFLKC